MCVYLHTFDQNMWIKVQFFYLCLHLSPERSHHPGCPWVADLVLHFLLVSTKSKHVKAIKGISLSTKCNLIRKDDAMQFAGI